jgi:2-polyprenyl-6-methoxyphenol hydroxylase-like FAD-dependent oxidoreductase
VEILTDSGAEAADPSGELVLENGRSLRADLVVAADGVRSKLRGSLNIGGGYRWLPTIVNRYLVTSREITPDLITREHWSGRCRVGVTPCGSNMTYVYQVCPEWDKVATALPNDVTYWSSAFPRLRRTFEILAHTEANRQNFSIVRCPRWQKGRVAIIGDAAHGLPPTLGQGVGLTLMNVHALAIRLEGNSDVQDVLPHWEAAVRSISDKTQRWAMRYDFFTRQWPSALWFARPAIIGAFRSIPALNRAMRIADQGLPSSALRSKALQ